MTHPQPPAEVIPLRAASRFDALGPLNGPNVLDDAGEPRFGAFRGTPNRIDYTELARPFARNRVSTFLRHKRWMYVFVATDDVIVTTAIADAGPTGTGFLMVTDRATGEVLVDISRPGGAGPLVSINQNPTDGHRSHYLAPGALTTMRSDDRELRVRSTYHRLPYMPVLSEPWVELDVRLGHDVHPGLTATAELHDLDLVTSTAKNAAVPSRGQFTVRQNGKTLAFDLSGGYGGFDYTSGYLPRHTSWRWAFATGALGDGRSFGLNLVSGFTGLRDHASENAVWRSGVVHPVAPAVRITFDADDVLRPWYVHSEDGSVELEFIPLAAHREGLNLGLIRSRFVQPTGHFSGTVRTDDEVIELDAMPGVIEDQDVLW